MNSEWGVVLPAAELIWGTIQYPYSRTAFLAVHMRSNTCPRIGESQRHVAHTCDGTETDRTTWPRGGHVVSVTRDRARRSGVIQIPAIHSSQMPPGFFLFKKLVYSIIPAPSLSTTKNSTRPSPSPARQHTPPRSLPSASPLPPPFPPSPPSPPSLPPSSPSPRPCAASYS